MLSNDKATGGSRGRRIVGLGLGVAIAGALTLATIGCRGVDHPDTDTAASAGAAADLADSNSGRDWPGYGQGYGERHYSPLAKINVGNVARLRLAWFYDLPAGTTVSAPVEVAGVLYTATGYSVVRAFAVRTGQLLWTYDSHAAELAGPKLRAGWGIKGLAWWAGRLFVGTQDGRLVAIDAQTGKPVWTRLTVDKDDYRFIGGAPRVFDGKVIIGHGGADNADTRGYVTAYDAATGRQLWRFFTVPGDPARGFEDATQAMAAKTWAGQWWKHGGGGTAWNAFAYDPETRTVFVGTGNGAPWNQRIRSAGKGDNLFLCSIVALDADTGRYKWHYQVNPGESWDYNAAMDMHLADLTIAGKPRKVLIQAPKNGFLYVIDRITGKLISADPFTPVTWAKSIDLRTGRPIEDPRARYGTPDGFDMLPGPRGAHGWLPSAMSPQSGLVYIPTDTTPFHYQSSPVSEQAWVRTPGNVFDAGVMITPAKTLKVASHVSTLLAWDPVARRAVWHVPTVGGWGGGVMATAGGLVFQGQQDGRFVAYDAATGKTLWSFAAQAPVFAPPVSYEVGGVQYVTVLSGAGSSVSVSADDNAVPVDYRNEARRVLTFVIGGTATLPPPAALTLTPPADPDYTADPAAEGRGAMLFAVHCLMCHGAGAASGGTAPDLRHSPVPASAEAFASILHGGALVPAGMPVFPEFTPGQLGDLRQYLRSRAAAARTAAAHPAGRASAGGG